MILAYRVMAAGAAVSIFISGCGAPPPQASPQISVAPVQPGAPAPIPAPAPASPPGDVESDTPRPPADADRLARQAEEHAKAIEALLAARAKEDKNSGVKVIEPVPRGSEAQFPDIAPAPSVPAPRAATRQQVDPFSAPGAPAGSTGGAAAVSVPPVPESQGANTALSVTPQPPSAPKGPAPAIHRGPDVPPAGRAEDSLEQELGKRARDYPRDMASQLDYQLALFLKDEQVPRAADVANLPAEDREVITALMDGMANFRNGLRADNNMLMTRKIRPLIEMSDRLRSRADLTIPFATLCREVKGFGAYTPFEATRFEAGIAHKAIVYAEIENFSSQLNEKNLWDTRLKQELALYTESGLSIWSDKIDVIDSCRNRRRDFFVVRVIQLPQNLNMGRYVLKVSVTDTQSNRIAETSVPIAIVAK